MILKSSLFKLLIVLRKLTRRFVLLLADIGLSGYRHKSNPSGFFDQKASLSQIIYDLDRLDLHKPERVQCVSHSYRHSDLPGYPSIELWVILNRTSVSQSKVYRRTQFHIIRQASSKPSLLVDEPLATFPHLTSHFGHWIGDQLGAIVWFARNRPWQNPNRRLLAIAPSHHWAELLQRLTPTGSLKLVLPSQFEQANWNCTDMVVLPRLSSWQNLVLARDALVPYLSDHVSTDLSHPEKIFLCSHRVSRIANLDDVIQCFVDHGYIVINPSNQPILPLYNRLRAAHDLWSEHGSMVLNPILCRTKPYRLFELHPLTPSTYPVPLTVLGGSIYNSFHRGLYRPFYCHSIDNQDNSLHPYQRQLLVNLDSLNKELSSESYL